MREVDMEDVWSNKHTTLQHPKNVQRVLAYQAGTSRRCETASDEEGS